MAKKKTVLKISEKKSEQKLKSPDRLNKKVSPFKENSKKVENEQTENNVIPLELLEKLEFIIVGMKLESICLAEKIDRTQFIIFLMNEKKLTNEILDLIKKDDIGKLALIVEFKNSKYFKKM